MAPRRAIIYVESFDLPQDEETCIIQCDIRQKSLQQVADMLHVSPECVKKRRQRAYMKIADGINI